MFASASALWFSKDSSNLAFIKFNDTDVDNFQFPIYGEPGDRDTVYPTWIDIFYPKPGHANPTVELNLVTLTDAEPALKVFAYDPPEDSQK